MRVGCVTEIKKKEYRVGLTPDAVKGYISAGHEVCVQKGAGNDHKGERTAQRGIPVFSSGADPLYLSAHCGR